MTETQDQLERALRAANERVARAVKALAPKHKGGEMEEFRDAVDEQLRLERRISLAKGDETALVINPDLIAQEELGDWNDPQTVLRAAQLAEERREACLGELRSLAFETVFAAPDKPERRSIDSSFTTTPRMTETHSS